MERKKRSIVSACTSLLVASCFSLSIYAESEPVLLPVNEEQSSAPVEETTTIGNVEITKTVEKSHIEQMPQYFSNLNESQVPSGILLQSGSLYFADTINQHNGVFLQSLITGDDSVSTPAMSLSKFRGSYAELERSVLFSHSEIQSLRSMEKVANKTYKNDGLVPLALSVIEYDSISDEDLVDENFAGKSYIPQRPGPVGEKKLFSGTAAMLPVVYGHKREYILKSSMITNNTNKAISDIVLKVDGKEYPIQIDVPFTVTLPKTTQRTNKMFQINYRLDGLAHKANGILEHVNLEITKKVNGEEKSKGVTSCYDMAPVKAKKLYKGVAGEIKIRIYPKNGSVSGTQKNELGCYEGSNPKLKQVMVILDGFDLTNERTQETIYEDFGIGIDAFSDMGFDLVVVNYKNGRTYVQRNGYAVQNLLVNTIPNWLASDADPHFVLTGGSMGAQIGRFAVRNAELDSELLDKDHNVRLFVSLDGPFRGANVPVGIQAFLSFFSDNPEVKKLYDSINSPAAKQMLIKDEEYQNRQEFIDYYAEMDTLGLPEYSRNISILSGSGTGTGQVEDDDLSTQQSFNYVHGFKKKNGIKREEVKVIINSDHNGTAFYAEKKFLSFPISSHKLTLSHAERLDVAPGGHRWSPKDIAAGWNEGGGLGNMEVRLDQHAFVPSYSALFTYETNPYYNPSEDTYFRDKTPFHAVWWEKCNVEHVKPSNGSMQFLAAELSAFLNKETPPEIELYQKKCGFQEGPIPEPVAKCSATYDDTGFLIDVELTADGSFARKSEITQYSWLLTNGMSGKGKDVSFSMKQFQAPSTLRADLEVTNKEGLVGRTSCYVFSGHGYDPGEI